MSLRHVANGPGPTGPLAYLCSVEIQARALRKVIAGRPVVCTERDRDRYGRLVAVCRAGGEDINAWMVAQGMAVAYTKYSRAYVGQQRSREGRPARSVAR